MYIYKCISVSVSNIPICAYIYVQALEVAELAATKAREEAESQSALAKAAATDRTGMTVQIEELNVQVRSIGCCV